MDKDVASWRWVVLAAAFFNLFLNASLGYNAGVLNIALVDEYQSDVFLISWLVSLYVSLFALAAPLGSIVINMSNCRTCVFLSGILSLFGLVSSSFVTSPGWLYLTITITGIGQSLSFVGGTVIIAFYFPTLTSIANGICSSGAGMGSFVHPVLLQALIDEYSLRGAFLILGGLSLNSCVTALIMRPLKIETERRKKNNKDSAKCRASISNCINHLHVLRYPAFICLTLSVFAYSFGFIGAFVYLPEYLVTVAGLTHKEASLMASLVGIGSVISRLFVGFAAADPKIGEELMFIGMNAVSFFLSIIATTMMRFHAGIYIFSFAFGFYASGIQSLLNPLTFRVLGFDKAPSGYGIVLLTFGCGSLMGPPFIALFVAKLGHEALFQFVGAVFLVASVLAVVLTLVPIPHSTTTTVAETGLSFLSEKNLHSSNYNIEFTVPAANGNDVTEHSNLLDKTEQVISNQKEPGHNSHAEEEQRDEKDSSIPLC